MPKYSVKKPFTILVAVILVLVLGFVSLTGIQTDLLPAMNLPYLLVMTTYPGASPEQVEADVTQPLENALSVLNGVKNVTSQSNENYSLIFLEYQDDTDMDSAMVKASTAVNQLGDALPDMASTPTLMEISPDMMATQYVAVDYDGMDIYELSDYVSENVLPQLERVDGVASVSTTGLVEKSVQITLDQDKIDAVNDKLLVKVSDRLADAKKELDDNKKKINDGLKELDDAQAQLDAGKSELNTQKADVTTQLRDAITELDKQVKTQAAEWRNYLMREKELDFSFRKERYKVHLCGLEIFPQGLAAVHNQGSMPGMNMLVDIGNGTMSILEIHDGRPMENSISTEVFGVHQCMEKIQKEVSKHSGVEVPEMLIEPLLRNGIGDPSILLPHCSRRKSVYCSSTWTVRQTSRNPAVSPSKRNGRCTER